MHKYDEGQTEAQQLLDKIRRQDETALGRLYDQFGGWIFSLVYGILQSRQDAEEVTQEVFHTVWTRADSYDTARGSARAWLATIARRKAIDRTRSKLHRSGNREVSADDRSNEQTERHDGGRLASRMELNTEARDVVRALEDLDSDHREVVKLSYLRGFSHAEIARILDTPLGTVKTRIRTALNRLRQALEIEV